MRITCLAIALPTTSTLRQPGIIPDRTVITGRQPCWNGIGTADSGCVARS